MEILMDLKKCSVHQLTPNEYILLYLLYYKNFDEIIKIYGKDKAIEIRNKLSNTKFILSDKSVKFTDTILSKRYVENLFRIKDQKINFWEWYNCYPIRVGNRVLRAKNPDSKAAKDHEKKYLLAVKDKEAHELAIKATDAFVASQRANGNMQFLPNILTVLNQRKWEEWEVLIEKEKEDNWQNETI